MRRTETRATQFRPKSIHESLHEKGRLHAPLRPLSGRRLQCHLLRDPKADTTADESKPNHQVGLDRDVFKCRHGLAEETRMDEEGGNANDGMILFVWPK